MIVFALVLQWIVTAVPATALASSAAGQPHVARLVSVRGLPADPGARTRFVDALHDELAAARLPLERGSDGAWTPAASVSNPFLVAEETGADSAWTLQISLGQPLPFSVREGHTGRMRVVPGRTASRGMVAAFVIGSTVPGESQTSETVRAAFLFPAPPAPDAASFGVPRTGYRYPWESAGRTVARLALDALLHRTGDLSDRERVALAPAERADAGR